ncbi:MAG: SDR family NAD(P)-dependent oxidoreductase [Chromatiaceae bacterium]|jgi:NAD(P)-dependent dehydrogenase (short-subunit alcohol dehydrogenase family)|nr:SDR family NAD(P)-dependent oxidoreductase [Chromatiaceae bacterium]
MTEQPDTAIVAGVGSGLGKALCHRFAEAGYRVGALARGTGASRDLAAELGPDRSAWTQEMDIRPDVESF